MKKSVSLCFTKTGLLNTNSIAFIHNNKAVRTIVLTGDGTHEALDKIKEFAQTSPILQLPQLKQIGMLKTPRYDLRVVTAENIYSDPHYLYDEVTKDKWFCSKVVAPHLKIYLSDITSQSATEVLLDEVLTQNICYLAYKFWSLLLVIEERLCFPAALIDLMTRWTYHLTKQTIDIELLKKETGCQNLNYNPDTDLLSVDVGGDQFFVKLSVLNETYGSLILPFFSNRDVRRLHISVAISGHPEHQGVTYGQLGSLIFSMKNSIKEQTIDSTHPINPKDLLTWAKKVKIDDESCIWLKSDETMEDLVERVRTDLVVTAPDNDLSSEEIALFG